MYLLFSQAHVGPVVCMEFDPTSTLLATGLCLTASVLSIVSRVYLALRLFLIQVPVIALLKYGIVSNNTVHTI